MKAHPWFVHLCAVGLVSTSLLAAPPAPRPSPGDAFDLNDDGTITAEELAQFEAEMTADQQAAFLARYDSIPGGATAGDGIITSEESFAVFFEEASACTGKLIARHDRNGDGSISRADANRGNWRQVWRLVRHLDADDDEVITPEELEAAATAEALERQARFLEIYDSVPEGAEVGDGTITAEESLAVHAARAADCVDRFLARFDANDDGTVTPEELRPGLVKGPRPGKGGR